MTFSKKLTTVMLATVLTAGTAFAKGHDQSNGADGEPGANTGSETAGPAQGLGAAKGNGQDNSGMGRGKSAEAGKPGE